MAMDDAERAYYAKAKAAGFPDDLIAERIRTRREETSPYKPTDYAGEAAKLPRQSVDPAEAAAVMARAAGNQRQAPEPEVDGNVDSLGDWRTAIAGTSIPGAPAANGPEEARGFMRFAAGQLAGTAGMGLARAAGMGPTGSAIIGGAAGGAAPAAMAGAPASEVLKDAALGASIPAIGGIAGAAGRAIRGGEGGRARALWEKHGGNVGPLDSGSGVDEIAGMEPTRANVGRASQRGAENIREALSGDFEKNTAAPYRAAREAVDYGPGGRELVDVSSLRGSVADELYAERTPQAVRPYLARELDQLDAMRSPDGRVIMTQSRLNELKQRLQDQANYGINTGAGAGSLKDQSFKSIANAAKVLVDEGPYAESNAGYAAGMSRQAEDRAALGLRKRPAASEAGRATEDAKVAQILRNRNNNAEAAGAMAERADIPGFVARHPELERQVDLPDLVRAKGKLQFGLDGSPTENLIEAARHRGVTGRALELARHNAAALAGRVAYRPAGIGIAADNILGSSEMNQILAAYAAQKEQERQRAEALGR